MEGVSEAEKQCNLMTCATLLMIDDMVKGVADYEVIENLIDQGKRSCTGTKNSLAVPFSCHVIINLW
eukprot:10599530-Ditylum_brightwellii.AAC.1